MQVKIGDKFSKWEVIDIAPKRGYRKVWLCRCECGVEKTVLEQNLKGLKSRSCGCFISEVFWKGFGEISLTYWSRLQRNSQSRKIKFSINIEYAWGLFLKQEKRCALSNEEILFSDSTSNNRRYETTASLDRIDSSKGYIEGNVQWVHKDINKLKGNMSDSDFITWCKRVAKCH